MNRATTGVFCLFALALPQIGIGVEANSVDDQIVVPAGDWPWWRGPGRNGIVRAEKQPPVEWDESKNVVWKSPIPGRGHSSPTLVGNQVFLTSADEQADLQWLLSYDRATGKENWRVKVHVGGIHKGGNKKASQASSSVACDGERLFVNFLNRGAIYTTAFSLTGKQLWQTKISDYVVHQGYGSSPCVYQSLVIVSADNKGGGAICGLDRKSGQVVWKVDRPKFPNYASPVVLHAKGRDQLVFTGCELVSSFDPLSGKKLWEIEGATTECVTSTVTDGERVFTSGGYPKNHVAAVRADGSGEIDWENKIRVYVPSILVRDGIIYAVADAGVAYCWRSDTGEELWKARLGGTFSSSPVMAGDQIFVTNEDGETYIFKASPAAFELFGTNKLGAEVYGSPAIANGRIYMRVVDRSAGQRQEMLYCLGKLE